MLLLTIIKTLMKTSYSKSANFAIQRFILIYVKYLLLVLVYAKNQFSKL